MVTAFGVFSDDLVSYTVGTETAKQGMITPPEDSTLVASRDRWRLRTWSWGYLRNERTGEFCLHDAFWSQI